MRALVIATLLLLAACSEPEPERLELRVGGHDIGFAVPQGWLLINDETGTLIKKDIAQVYINDAGPVTVHKFQREIERARDIFRGGDLARANDVLNALRLRSSFNSIERWKSFADSLNKARGLWLRGKHPDPDVIERAYTEMLVQLASLQDRDISALAMELLGEHEPLDRRSVAEQRALLIDGRSALRIDTWDKLNHTGRKRYVFIINDGSFLVVRTGLGPFSETRPALDALVDSLSLHSNPGQS